jgi:hypothetical protein
MKYRPITVIFEQQEAHLSGIKNFSIPSKDSALLSSQARPLETRYGYDGIGERNVVKAFSDELEILSQEIVEADASDWTKRS